MEFFEERYSEKRNRVIWLEKSKPNGIYWIVTMRPIENNPMSGKVQKHYKTEKRAREVFNK